MLCYFCINILINSVSDFLDFLIYNLVSRLKGEKLIDVVIFFYDFVAFGIYQLEYKAGVSNQMVKWCL